MCVCALSVIPWRLCVLVAGRLVTHRLQCVRVSFVFCSHVHLVCVRVCHLSGQPTAAGVERSMYL